MTAWQPVLLANVNQPNSEKIKTYLGRGGYEALRKALQMSPEQVIAKVKASGLRGRGGAGFPTGVKWGFIAKDAPVKYLAVNTDEGEPGTFKDRLIVERDPHSILEGVIISAYAVGAQRAFVYIRGEFFLGVKRWIKAISDAYQYGFLGKNILGSGFDLDVSVHRGAGAYICGEETAMIESLEGKRGEPRLKPPYPAQVGLWSKPTVVQNVETLANIPHIINRGAAWYASIGTEQSKGPKIFCVSGHVNRPGNYELPLGVTLREMIYEHAGGVRDGPARQGRHPGRRLHPAADRRSARCADGLRDAGRGGFGAGHGRGDRDGRDHRHGRSDAAHHQLLRARVVRALHAVPDRRQADAGAPGSHGQRQGPAGRSSGPGEVIRRHRGVTFCPMGTGMCEPVASGLKLFRAEFESRAHAHV